MLKGKGSTRQDRRPHEDSDALGQSPSGTKQQSAAELSADAVRKLSILGKMTGGIVHDFRNILAVIDSGLRLAENSCNDPKAARNFITGAREGIARGLALTSQLLTFATQREFQARAADPNELLKALELFLRYGAGSEVRVILELSPKIPNCLVDPSQFNAAIVNLVINARDAMPHGGEIQISTVPWGVRDEVWEAKSDYYVRVRVRDNGLGMADEVLQKIFQPFFTTKGENGTGL